MSDQTNYQGDAGNVVALEDALTRWHAEADDEDAQLGLFGEPQTEAGRQKALVYKRGPGRPPGSRNKRTERTVAFLLARHRDPCEVLLEMAEANVHDLAALYGCSVFEAAQEKRLAAIAVLPYVAQRQPLAVDITSRKVIYLTISDGQAQLAGPGEDGIAMNIGKVIDNAEFVEIDPARDSADGENTP